MAVFVRLRRELRDGRLWHHEVSSWRCLAQLILEWVGTLLVFGNRESIADCMELYEALKARVETNS